MSQNFFGYKILKVDNTKPLIMNIVPKASTMSYSEDDPPTGQGWVVNGSCHNPLLLSDAEYLNNNPLLWGEISRAIVLFIISFLIIIFNIFLLCSINLISIRW